MHTLKRFINYYAPYRTVFFLDLFCATLISLVDLAYPQILRTLTNTLFTEDAPAILRALPRLRRDFWSCTLFRASANIMSATRGI